MFSMKKILEAQSHRNKKKEENNVKDLWLDKLPQITKKILIIAKI